MLSAYRLRAGSAAPTTRPLTLRRTGPGRLNPVSTCAPGSAFDLSIQHSVCMHERHATCKYTHNIHAAGYPHLEPIINPGAIGVDRREAVLSDDALDSARHLRFVMQHVMHVVQCRIS